jgi:phosphate starvation-inducible protein PhoH
MRTDWGSKLEQIKQLASSHSRHEAAAILGTSTDNFRKICERYNIDISERKPYLKLVRQSSQESEIIEREKALIDKRNELLMKRWIC